jgi:hypothetical protein
MSIESFSFALDDEERRRYVIVQQLCYDNIPPVLPLRRARVLTSESDS